MDDNYTLNVDGSSKGNPGNACAGIYIQKNEKPFLKMSKYLGDKLTNNESEYLSLKYGIEECIKNNILIIDIFMDSQLVVNQMNKKWKVRHPNVVPIYKDICNIINENKIKYTITHVRRHLNTVADELSNDYSNKYELFT